MSDSTITTPDPGPLAWRVFRQRPVFMAVLDPDGIVREVNDAPEARGFGREEFLGRHIADTPYFGADSTWHQTWNQRLGEVARAAEPCGYDDVITTTQGQVRYAEATVSPITGDDGRVEFFLVEADDTTERLQVELALREGERRSNDLMVALPVLAWSIDRDGECDFVNQRWLDEVGAVPIVDGRPQWAAVVHPDDRGAFEAAWATAKATASPLTGEFRITGISGAARRCEVRIAPVLGDDGTVDRWSAVAIDAAE
ncbi:MAG: PAS domain-containing protein [Solirubrobacteraceae bacterium]|nr:PAS domain-containing protein [Solirubrobacteraceae bacterium]